MGRARGQHGGGSPSPARRGRPREWSDERIEQGLRELLAGQDEWPAQRWFTAQGPAAQRLYNATVAQGGVGRWASALGLSVQSRGRPREWSEERIERALRTLLAGQAEWPTQRWFTAQGRDARRLYKALVEHGGTGHWAARLGLPIRAQQQRHSLTPDEARAEAEEVIAERGRLPSADVLRTLGRTKLATSVARAGGARRFCERHRLPLAG